MSELSGAETVGGAKVRIDPDLDAFRAELLAGLKQAMAGVAESVRITADDVPFKAKVAEDLIIVKSFATQVAEAKLTVNASEADATLARTEALTTALSDKDVLIRVKATVDENTALFRAASVGGIGALLGAGLLGAMGVGAGGGKGGGIMSALGFGGAGGLFGLGAIGAAFGSVGQLLGFGVERILTTILGIAGSAVGGLLGGGLLALGGLGTMGVGMGTDLAGIGQAAGDIKNVVQAQNQLNQAIAVYGRNSIQAKDAQAQLNYTLSSFSPVARSAVLAAANTAQAFHAAFNAATGQAEKVGAEIINQAMKVGMAFLPTIGKFAAENLGIIQRDIQPLFAWLQNPSKSGGLGIFTDLERIFQANLPAGIHAFTQALELFAKTVDVAAHYTGGFIQAIDKFLTRMNTPAGFAKWAKDIGTLIGMFRTWMGFLLAVGRTLVDIFKPAAGAGTAIIRMLTSVLGLVDTWLTKTSTKNDLKGLFSAHLVELIKGIGGVIKAAIPLVLDFAGAFVKILTVGAQIGTILLQPLGAFLRLIDKAPIVGQLLGWAVAIAIVGRALMALTSANPVLLAISLAIVGIYELVKHWSAVWTGAKRVFQDVWHAIEFAVGHVVAFTVPIIKTWLDVWLTIFGALLRGAVDAFGWIPGIGGKLKGALKAFDSFKADMDKTLSNIAADAKTWGTSVGAGFAYGVASEATAAAQAAADIAAATSASLHHAIRNPPFPSKMGMDAGQSVAVGFVQGILSGTGLASGAAKQLAAALKFGWNASDIGAFHAGPVPQHTLALTIPATFTVDGNAFTGVLKGTIITEAGRVVDQRIAKVVKMSKTGNRGGPVARP